jgi:trans-o-hydroxybenzylidenepyruvate hydratase-aldolase
MLSAKEIRGLYAIIPTPARPGANSFGAKNTVDLEETSRLVDALIRDGASGLITTGTTGECATLSDPDFRAFAECVLETVQRRIPTFIGATALGSHETARRLDFVRDLGADGTLLGLPMWQPVTTSMAVDYYREASEYRPDLAVMVYANARAFRYNFPIEFWEAVAKNAETVIAAKASRPNDLARLIEVSGQRINFLPIDTAAREFYAISPQTTTACWATAAAMGPQPSVALMAAILRKDEAAIEAISAEIAWANEPISGIVQNPEIFAQYNIQVEKFRIEAAGYCHPGPIRSPYDYMPAEYIEASRECGRRWASLCHKFTAKKQTALAS